MATSLCFEWYCVFYAIVCWKYIICLLIYGITFKKLLWMSEESLKHGLLNSIKNVEDFEDLWRWTTYIFFSFWYNHVLCTIWTREFNMIFLNEGGSYKLKYSVDCLERIRSGGPVWGDMSLGWFWNLKWVLLSSVSASCLQIKMWSLSCCISHGFALSSWNLTLWNIDIVKAFPQLQKSKYTKWLKIVSS